MKIPKIEQLPSGHYFCRLRINGVSIPITAETADECETLAILKKAELKAGKTRVQKTPKNTTLKEAMEKYIAHYRSGLSPSTVDRYLQYKDGRFKNYLDLKLSEIKWQKMIDDELKLASEKTVANAWGLVRPSLKHVGYPVPRVKIAPVPVKEIPFLQPEEIKPFCQAVKGRNYEIAALIELHGLRLSEMKALDWKDIDLNNGIINVRGAYVKGPDGFVDKETNKNKTSTRPVPIMIPQLAEALNAVEQKEGRVVTIHESVLLRDVKRACERAGVTVVTNHGLRHSFASLCFYLKIPNRQIKEWGGWKNDITLNRIYIRLAASMQTENKNTFTKFFEDKKSANGTDPSAL